MIGLKGYVTNLETDVMAATEVIGKDPALRQVERSFQMSKSELQARPMFHRARDSVTAPGSRWLAGPNRPSSGWTRIHVWSAIAAPDNWDNTTLRSERRPGLYATRRGNSLARWTGVETWLTRSSLMMSKGSEKCRELGICSTKP